MTGFFTSTETQTKDHAIKSKGLSCYACGLYSGDIRCPKLEPSGGFKRGILNIGDFTSYADDQAGKPFQGQEKGIYRAYEQLGIDIERDCLNINAVRCHTFDKTTGKSRLPTQKEVDCCRLSVFRTIQQYKPKLIVLFGKIALTSVIGSRWKGSLDGIDKWRGFVIPDQELRCWIAPVFAPSYVKQSERPEVELVWKQDLRNALEHLDKDFPIYVEPLIIETLDLSALNGIENNSTIAFDYETTGLKPHAEGHRIVCCSVAVDADTVYVFAMPKSVEAREPFIKLLKNRYIKKVAANMKYEETWSWVKLKTRVKGWFHDTMQAAHILDNRTGITGLKFQVYINFGVIDYSSTVSPWLQAVDSKNANSKNRLEEYFATKEGRRETLKYCGLDAINEFRLAEKQIKEIEYESLPF
jgi:uracil-DNA glycosylase family 4